MNPFYLIFSFIIIDMLFISVAYGHGLGGEVLPPIFLEGRDVILSINVSPTTYDQNDLEHFITINLIEAKSQALVEHVTFEFELIKNGKTIFKDFFHDDLGNLVIKVVKKDTNQIQIKGDRTPGNDSWMRTTTNPVTLEGPIFSSGGLYEYKIKIVTMDSDDNFLDKPVELNGAISLSEHNTFEITDNKKNIQPINLISYFDKIQSFEYNSGKMTFSMPFDWNQNIDQLSVVHQEIQIPENLSEFLYTRYEAKINGVLLDDKFITIDDYSSAGRTIHIVANKEILKQIKEKAIERSDSIMYFEIGPSQEINLPLEAITPDLRFRIFLSWEPEFIQSKQDVTFYLKLEEMFAKKSEKDIQYGVALSQEGKTIFEDKISGKANSEKPDHFNFQFSPDNVGTIKLDVFDIEGNSLSKANFLIVVNPQQSENFPIRLESIPDGESGKAKYNVDLTWFPNNLGLGESEFVITFYEKSTGLPVRGASYDFVVIKDSKEIHRKSGIANAGGTFENFVFVEGETGDLTLRIEKIDGTNEYVQIPIHVAPEFPFAIAMILGILIFCTIIISKTRLVKINYH